MKVLVLSAPVEPPLYVELGGRLITLGRDPGADVCLPDPTVSPRHATLKRRGDRYLLTDEGSTRGTALSGAQGGQPVWLSPGSPRVIEDGDRVLLGCVELELRTESEAEGRPSDDLARDLVTASMAALGLPIDPERITAALDELRTLPDEPTPPAEAAEPDPPVDAAGVVSGVRLRAITDFAVAGVALLLILISGLGLHLWVLGR